LLEWGRNVTPNPIRSRAVRYVVYDPKDPRKGQLIADSVLGQIVLGEGSTITKALAAATASAPLASGTVVWDRSEARVAYRVP
jgi:hypothetical protein